MHSRPRGTAWISTLAAHDQPQECNQSEGARSVSKLVRITLGYYAATVSDAALTLLDRAVWTASGSSSQRTWASSSRSKQQRLIKRGCVRGRVARIKRCRSCGSVSQHGNNRPPPECSTSADRSMTTIVNYYRTSTRTNTSCNPIAHSSPTRPPEEWKRFLGRPEYCNQTGGESHYKSKLSWHQLTI